MKKGLVLLGICLLYLNIFSQTIFDHIKENNFKAVKKYKGDINIRDEYKATPLMWATYECDLKMVKLLLKKGADPYLKGWISFIDTISLTQFMYGSCLVTAAGEGKIDILKYLLHNENVPIDDPEINLYDNLENGWSALHWAAAKGNTEVIEFLIKEGANINAPAATDYNQTPLLFALRYGKNEAAKLLIDLGADINQKDGYDNSPLILAVHNRNKELVKYLIEKGARPGVQGLNINDLLKQYFRVESYQEL